MTQNDGDEEVSLVDSIQYLSDDLDSMREAIKEWGKILVRLNEAAVEISELPLLAASEGYSLPASAEDQIERLACQRNRLLHIVTLLSYVFEEEGPLGDIGNHLEEAARNACGYPIDSEGIHPATLERKWPKGKEPASEAASVRPYLKAAAIEGGWRE